MRVQSLWDHVESAGWLACVMHERRVSTVKSLSALTRCRWIGKPSPTVCHAGVSAPTMFAQWHRNLDAKAVALQAPTPLPLPCRPAKRSTAGPRRGTAPRYSASMHRCIDRPTVTDRTRSAARARSVCCSKLRSAIERHAAGPSLHQLYREASRRPIVASTM